MNGLKALHNRIISIIAAILAFLLVISSPALADGLHQAHPDRHETLATWDGAEAPPKLAIEVLPDPVSGWNLHIKAPDFRFAPEHAGLKSVPGEGHAHIYVNHRKVSRLYGEWLHLPYLPPDGSEVAVTLNTNEHDTYAVDGAPLRTSVIVSTPPTQVVELNLRANQPAHSVKTIRAKRGEWVEVRVVIWQ